MIASATNWNPTTFERFERCLSSSMKTSIIVTDAGRGYIKPMGSPRGPHPLACELVGTQLAHWFGLPTLDFSILYLDDTDEIPLHGGGFAERGPAFITRAIDAFTWSGSEDIFDKIENIDIINRLVVFDTWTLNWDRCPPEGDGRKLNHDNVLLTGEGSSRGKLNLVAFDHTECFSCGQDLNNRLANISRIRDDKIYGLFEAFKPYLDLQLLKLAAEDVGNIEGDMVEELLNQIPAEWQVSRGMRAGLKEFICRRATYIAENIVSKIHPKHFVGKLF